MKAATQTASTGTEQQPIQVTAVAVMRDDGDGGLEPDWLLEGGTAELMAGMVLVVAEGDITDDDGHGEVYTNPIAQTEQQWPTAYPHEAMDKLATDRYRVGSAGAGTLHRFAVRAGDGEQELYRGSESDCQNVARKLAGAFLDGYKHTMPFHPTWELEYLPWTEREVLTP